MFIYLCNIINTRLQWTNTKGKLLVMLQYVKLPFSKWFGIVGWWLEVKPVS